MNALFREFGNAVADLNGHRLGNTLSPQLSAEQLTDIWRGANSQDPKQVIRRFIQQNNQGSRATRLPHDEVQGWVEVYNCYWKCCGDLLAAQEHSSGSGKLVWVKVYESWKDLVSALIRGYQSHSFEAWTIPCLYIGGRNLRLFAMKADQERNSISSAPVATGPSLQDDFDPESDANHYLEDCARQLNRIFNLCLSDRAPLEDSRKWGIYYVINLLFKTYFKLNSASLSKNILKALSAGRGDMPPFSALPKSQQATFKYYEGVLSFLEEDYTKAEKHLTMAWNLCHKDAKRNKELILTYLIPCHLLTTHTLPSPALLDPYPRLQKLFSKLSGCIKKGDLLAFDQALQEGEDDFIRHRIYLTLERGRDIALRNILRKVFLTSDFEEPKESGGPKIRRTRVPIAEFAAAISLGSQKSSDIDDIECLLANMIYKGHMKGYIAREHGLVVLSKANAFPGTGV